MTEIYIAGVLIGLALFGIGLAGDRHTKSGDGR